ncbi:MAG: OOP family OmpA-OmpF porin, partial [Polaribacter sp.]
DPEQHIGNGALSPDGQRFYFTQCQENFVGKVICHLYYAEKEGDKWGESIKMNDQINLPNFTTTQPTVGRESKRNQEVIYFISDRPEGKGGLDIWYTEFHARTKRFRTPKNAGAAINTPGTEFTPFYDVSTHSLYFSTDGRVGLGGLDVYKIEGEKTKWSKDSLQHLGKAVNSPADDFDFVLNKDRQTGFLVSNREGGVALMNATCCDDIYSFEFVEYVNIHLNGLVIDTACLDEVDVLLYMKDPSTGEKYLVEELRVNPCTFSFTLEPDRDYTIEAKKNGYFNDMVEATTKNLTPADTLNIELKLTKIPKKPIVLEGILYDFDSANLTASAKVSLDTGLYPIMIENPQIIIELSSHTDAKGSDAYNLNLSKERAKSVVDYMISMGIDSRRLKDVGYGESKPIAANENPDGSDNPEGRGLNRRTEFEIIGELSEDEYLPEQD